MAMEREIDFILSRTRTYFGSQTPQDTKYTNETKTALINNFPMLEAEYSKLKGTPQGLRLFNKGQLVQNSYLYKSIFRSQLEELAQFEQGRRLLHNVYLHMQQEVPSALTPNSQSIRSSEGRTQASQLEIVLSNTGDNQYHPNSNRVILNFNKAIATQNIGGQIKLFSVYPTVYGTITDPSNGKQLIVSKDGLSPYFISAFHELNHYKDHKEFNPTVRPFTLFNSLIQKYRDTATEIIYFPKKDESDDRISSIRHNVLEHRAIFDGDPNNTSELRLRMEAGEPIRYLYQPVGSGKILYEPIESVIKNATKFAPTQAARVEREVIPYLCRSLPFIQPIHMNIKYMKTETTDNILEAESGRITKGLAFLERYKRGEPIGRDFSLTREEVESVPSDRDYRSTLIDVLRTKLSAIHQQREELTRLRSRIPVDPMFLAGSSNQGIPPLSSLPMRDPTRRAGSSTASSMRSPFAPLALAMPVAKQRSSFPRSFSPPARSGATALPPPRRASTSPVTTSNSKGSFSPSRWKG